jgi:hypothetical protein
MVPNNPKPHTLFLVPKLKRQAREFSIVQRELEQTSARLRDCREPNQRAQLLREMRILIEEADRASGDLKPALQVLHGNRG